MARIHDYILLEDKIRNGAYYRPGPSPKVEIPRLRARVTQTQTQPQQQAEKVTEPGPGGRGGPVVVEVEEYDAEPVLESYDFPSTHRNLIEDRVRTESYRRAIIHNKHLFKVNQGFGLLLSGLSNYV
jgi:hypothetical protein